MLPMAKERISLSEHFTYKKILQFTLPSILMMIFSSIYSVIDGFFVSNFSNGSSTPFAGLNFIYPFIAIIGAGGFLLGSGGSALIGKYLGEKNTQKANNTFSMIITVAIFSGILFMLIGGFTIKPLAVAMGAEGELLEYALLYGRICLVGTPFYMLQFMFQPLYIVAEKPHQGFFTIVAAGVTNIVLDFIFIVLCHLHVIGAAIATSIGMAVGGIIPLIYFMRKNDSLLKIVKFKFDLADLGKLSVNGLSEYVGQVAFSIVGILYNYQLLKYYGQNGVSAYGVLMYVGFIFIAIFIGYTTSISQVTSYHFGAKNKRELHSILAKSLIILSITGIVMTGLAEALAYPISLAYVGYDKELLELTVGAFRIFALQFLVCGFSMYLSGFFTALNDGITSATISFLRTLVFQVLFIIFFPLWWGAKAIWWSIVMAEVVASLLAFIFLFIREKKFGYFYKEKQDN